MKNVLLIDSGSGGVNILKECVRVCPFCNFLLFCDDKNLPYGSKSKEQLQQIAFENLKMIEKFFKFDIVVLACNTLSCTCLDRLREVFPQIVFVGTVPAVKPALEEFVAEDVLVLATETTLRHNALIRKNPSLQKLAMPWLASEIDAHIDELEMLRSHLEQELTDVLQQKRKPKAVVLGCTHYLAVKDILQNIFGGGVKFFDGANGVARRLKHFVLEEPASDGTQCEEQADGECPPQICHENPSEKQAGEEPQHTKQVGDGTQCEKQVGVGATEQVGQQLDFNNS